MTPETELVVRFWIEASFYFMARASAAEREAAELREKLASMMNDKAKKPPNYAREDLLPPFSD